MVGARLRKLAGISSKLREAAFKKEALLRAAMGAGKWIAQKPLQRGLAVGVGGLTAVAGTSAAKANMRENALKFRQASTPMGDMR